MKKEGYEYFKFYSIDINSIYDEYGDFEKNTNEFNVSKFTINFLKNSYKLALKKNKKGIKPLLNDKISDNENKSLREIYLEYKEM